MSKNQVFCLVRKRWVAAQPEELVRQKLLSHLIHNLGYPASSLVLEQSLKQMPHLALEDIEVPERRADVIVFGKDIHPQYSLYPLLLIECKAIPLSNKVIDQVTGYNHFLKAFFVSVVNGNEVKTGWLDPATASYSFTDRLLPYSDLLTTIKR